MNPAKLQAVLDNAVAAQDVPLAVGLTGTSAGTTPPPPGPPPPPARPPRGGPGR